jgi:hypothetical protein
MRILTWSPGHALFGQPYEMGNLACDLARFGRMIRGELEPKPSQLRTWATHHDLASLVKTGEPLACDIETAPANSAEPWTGKDPTRAKLKTIGFGTCMEALSIYWPDADETTQLMVREVLADAAVKKVFHNGPWFDHRVLNRYGLPTTNFDDTRDMRRVLSSTSRLSLLYLGSIYTDFHNWKDAEEDEEKTWESTDLEKLMLYNALDCIVTARVYRGILRDWEAAE